MEKMLDDTIAAIATGLTESGIGIVRMSGPDSYEIIRKIFTTGSGRPLDLTKTHRVHYGFINVSRETSDEVLMINMKGPRSYTGEDTIEIDCHGGVLMMKRILEAVIAAGARPADPGEFTKRAFLNGRIDLSQAEAVADIISAKNDSAITASTSQLKGSVSSMINAVRDTILEKCAFIEAALDDPEHYTLEGFSESLKPVLEELLEKINGMIDSYRYGKTVKEGINTVIIGKPNAGKSSLLNAMLGEERAIVTKIPGTTRDTINETVSAGGISLNLMDTAGIRETDDPVESIGVRRALDSAAKADLVLCVLDASERPDEQDLEIFKSIDGIDKRIIYLFNKTDLAQKLTADDIVSLSRNENADCLSISAKNGTGIEELFKHIEELYSAGDVSYNDQTVITSVRHVNLLKEAGSSLKEVVNSIDSGMPEDFLTIDMMSAYRALGGITGAEVGEDLINEIFSKFCMGK